MKRIISILLTLLLIISIMPTELFTITASAATEYTEGNYTYTVSNNEATITDVDTAISGDVTIPSTLGGYTVTSIGNDAFFNCNQLTSITIPDSVTSICEFAFYNCTSLKNITISDSVTSIGFCAFRKTAYYNNSSNWENEILYINNHLIEAQTDINGAYIVKEGTKTIAYNAFCDCTRLTSLTIPDGVISIGEGAFGYCDNLRELQLPNSVKYIGGGAFGYCDSLTSITLPDQLETINDHMFDGCTLLRYVSINSNILYVGDYAFRECRSLVNISLPRSVTYIGSGAFYYCVGLTDFVIPENVLSIGEDAFSLCAYLSRLTVPVSVKSIGEDAFSGSTNWLREVCYGGNKSQRAKIEIGAGNDNFLNRFWKYKLCDEHTYQYACSEECSECNYNRTCTNHTYDNTCDIDCNTCGDIRTITHTYSNNCDTQCNVCGYIRTINNSTAHTYSNSCDTQCNLCDYVRSITHNYKWVIDKQETCGESGLKHEECTVCHAKRNENRVISATGNHTYDNECDTQCNVCEAIRTITHKYDNECDTDCNVCGYIRSTTHTYESDNDLTCNICKYSRTPNKPTPATIRAFSIELEIVEGCEYSIDGITWQKEPLFVNLIPETEYSFYQRVKESASAKVSEKSEPTTVKTARAYTITYDANGGTDTPQLQLKDIGVDITLTNDKPIREGYTFIGWSTEKAGDVNFNCGDFYSIDKDLVLFAVWRVTCETCNGSGKVQGICDQCGGSGKIRFNCSKHDSATPYCADCGSRSYSFNPNFKCNDCYSTRMALYLCYYCKTQDGYWYVDCSKCISGVASVECEKCLGNGYEFDVFKILTHISINTKPNKLTYIEGDSFDKTGMVVKAYYDNNTSEVITDYVVSGYSSTVGTKAITVSYCGKMTLFEVIVKCGNHVYSNNCDTTCNVCDAKRTITHKYVNDITKATLKANGKIVKKCSVCGNVASTTAIKYPKSFALTTTNYTYTGAIRTPGVIVKDSAGKTLVKNKDYTVSYSSGRKNIGAYKVTVTMKGNYSGTKTLTFKINPKIKLSATSYTYDGKTKTPTVKVTNSAGTKLSTKYYTVSYSAGRKNVGTYTATIKFKNGHSGTYKYTFKINPKIKLSATSYTYDGKVKKPSVTVTNAAGKKFSTKYYTVSYSSGRKNVGTYTATIKFKNGHSGTYKYTFKINPPKTTVSKLTAGKKSITVAISKKSSQVTGYQVQYSTSKSFSKPVTKTISSYKTTKYTLKSLSAKKTYYVRVRTYKTVGKTKYYSGWSTYKYVKTK